MVRLSEIYLIRAEALIHLGQYNDAKNTLSIFAQRRNLPLGELNTEANALHALYTITRAETYRDGRTFINLVRWGIAKEVLENYKDHNNILPIPESLLQTDPGNKQNPGY